MKFKEILQLSRYLHRNNYRVLNKYKLILNRFVSQSSATSSIQPHINIESESKDYFKEALKHPDYFNVAELFTVEDLFKANVHLGHREGTLNNYMKPYIFGSRLGHLIFDLDQTATILREALNFTAHIAFRAGIILFVCRGAQHQILVEKTAENCSEYAHTREWHPLTFTDSAKFYGYVMRLPDTIILLNTMENAVDQHSAVIDSAKLSIPTIGIVDSNCDPRLITYAIPGNDDTHSAIKLYCNLFKNAILKGKQKRKELGLFET